MRNTPALQPSDLDGLKKLQDAPLAQYLLQIALASEKIAELKTQRAANTIKRVLLLALIHKTLMGPVAQRRQLEAEWANTKIGLETNIQAALKTGNYVQVGSPVERLRVTQEHHETELAKLEGGLTPEGKIAKLTRLSQRTDSLTKSLQKQEEQMMLDARALATICENAGLYAYSGVEVLEKKAQLKKPTGKTLPSIYQPQPKAVDEKAQTVAKELSAQAIQAYLTAVYRGELDTVETLLKANPSLTHAQGDLTDLSKRTFTNITGFQYAVWALDGPMWDVILKYLPHADAKAQMEAYTTRQDLIQQHGLQYSFDNLLKQYDLFIENYYPKWTWHQLRGHWVKKIAPEQAKMPSWMIYAFTEPGENVAWVKLDVERGYLRVLSNEFKDFHRIIESGNGFLRYSWSMAWGCCDIGQPELWGSHDRMMMTNFKAKSNTQHQDLVNTLTQATDSACTITPYRPGQ